MQKEQVVDDDGENRPVMRRVSWKQSIPLLRSEDSISAGASVGLMNKLKPKFDMRRASSVEFSPAQYTFITSLIEDLQWALRELGYDMDMKAVEGWAIFLHEMLTRDSRRYHGISHVYEMCAGASPLQFLAAVFRDVVSHYIDREVDPKQQALVGDVLVNNVLNPELYNQRDVLVARLFGFQPGDDLASHEGLHKSLDVFLSAICAARLFGYAISVRHLAQIVVCLEATIPFRKPKNGGPKPLDVLFDRLVKCNEDFALDLSDSDMIETLQQAADLANRSVGNMANDDIAEFLDHTWSLLPEQNIALRKSTLYTVCEYYHAIHAMVHVLESMDPDGVYQSFQNLPVKEETEQFRSMMKRNMGIALLYIRARMLTVSIVSAFAILTGGDAPKSFFFGDLPSLQSVSDRLGDYLTPLTPDPDTTEYNVEVYDLLRGNSMADTGFDTRNAPLAAYCYQRLGDKKLLEAVSCYCPCPLPEDCAWELLKALDYDMVCTVGNELASVAISRAKGIQRVLTALEPP